MAFNHRTGFCKKAIGDIIAYTDDDCQPDRDWLFWLSREFDDPDVGAAGGPNIPPEPESLQEAIVAAGPGAPSHVLLTDTRAEHLPGCNIAIRAELLERIHGFRAQFHAAGDDVDLCWRITEAGWELAFAPCAFVWHRRRATFLRYLRQQAGYGEAEALLYESHPERFAPEGIRWHGSIYGGGSLSVDPQATVHYGPGGSAPYQMVTSSVMPRRLLHRKFRSWGGRMLLRAADFLQPLIRSWVRARHGGLRPSRMWSETREVFTPDTRHCSEATYSGEEWGGRTRLLEILERIGWERCAGDSLWDLQHHSLKILTATEAYDHRYYVVRVRLLHPPGVRERAWPEIKEAALAAGLETIS